MQPLKKYFTEGLIQVAIVLSLAGMHVDVDPYLPPPHNLNIQSPDLTQTQSSILQNSPEGYGLQMKSLDVEASVPIPRLLHWIRSLQQVHVPTAHLVAWLVHSETDNNGMTMPSLTGSWDGNDELGDIEDSTSLTIRMGGGGIGEFDSNNPAMDDGSLGVATTFSRNQIDYEDIKEEAEEFPLWQQELHQNVHQDQLLHGQNHYFSLLDEDDEDELMVDRWHHANPFHYPATSVRGNVQFTGLQEDTLLSTEEGLQLMEATFPLGQDQYLADLDPVRADENLMQRQVPLFSPLLPQYEPLLDLEQQWQDVLAVLEPQDINAEDFLDSSHLNDVGRARESLPQFPSNITTGQDHSLSNQNNISLNVSNSSNVNLSSIDSDIIDFLLSPTPESTNVSIPGFSMEEPSPLSFFGPLLKEPMLDENALLDLALGNSSGQSEVFQNEDETDSDSGLSLNYSQSPVSPSRSESSCCSSSSSSSSSIYSIPEEGAVGYTRIKDEQTDEEGAVGGYTTEQGKMWYTNYLQFQYLPWLEHIVHDHTYNQPQYTSQRKPPKEDSEEVLEYKFQEGLCNRDEKRARAMRIPFSTDHIINLPVEEFNDLLAKHRLSETQLALIRDIRRRGKNKVAAQNCRRRKLDVLEDLECSVNGLRRHRARLLREKSEVLHSVREMKQHLNDLYQEVRSRLRDVERIPCPVMDFTLQPGKDSHASKSRRKSGKKQKDKE